MDTFRDAVSIERYEKSWNVLFKNPDIPAMDETSDPEFTVL